MSLFHFVGRCRIRRLFEQINDLPEEQLEKLIVLSHQAALFNKLYHFFADLDLVALLAWAVGFPFGAA